MILVDANILLYAEDSLNSNHDKARKWWDGKLSGTETICLCWTVLAAFIRIGTNARVFEAPLSLEQATTRVQSWLDQPNTRLINPTDQHWRVFQQLLLDSKALANLVTDAHIAALAIEHGCEVASSDSDFARFPKLKWFNPLV
ncbi:MAG: type II toxin-antitoxin system VapC family toxin [Proteobacteria bacterium]|nr:type II toxin-antitoxin system VapC family toxin [Pseudomonadota bacterium]MBU4470554.1 type II toxin-antitoxin system VapC family toxin [Pseudomonadota bacterium]MCG2751390.1 type II toxin-antitoxin system VapC family toxin [Desulfobacteraceae bacterium]